MPVRVVFPIPPSVNHMYRHGPRGQKYLAPAYKEWKYVAGMALLPHKRHFMDCEEPPYEYQAWFHFPNRRRSDADNRLKALQDVVATTFGFDDSEILDGQFHKRIDRVNPRCEIEIWGNG